jgi:hypothetical protein
VSSDTAQALAPSPALVCACISLEAESPAELPATEEGDALLNVTLRLTPMRFLVLALADGLPTATAAAATGPGPSAPSAVLLPAAYGIDRGRGA